MDHRPFEHWLLDEQPLDSEQQRDLEAHLAECPDCARLAQGWGRVEALLQGAEHVEPPQGFVTRWEARLARQQARTDRRLGLLLFGVNATAATLLLILWLTDLLPTLPTPAGVLASWIDALTSLFAFAKVVLEVAKPLLQTLFGALPLSGWLTIAASLGAFLLLWIATLRQYASRQGAER